VNWNGTTTSAHRVAWILEHGEPPPGHLVEPCARDGRCCNVLHLRLRPPRPRPVRVRMMLTPAAREAIRAAMCAERAAGATLSHLARRYGLHSSTVSRAVRTIAIASRSCATHSGREEPTPGPSLPSPDC